MKKYDSGLSFAKDFYLDRYNIVVNMNDETPGPGSYA